MTEILTPRCPLCDEPPLWILGGGTQAFCGSDDCPVFTWNTLESREHFLRTAKHVTLQDNSSEEGQGDGHP